MSDPSQSIIILGAGAFGLSTALHLAQRGKWGNEWHVHLDSRTHTPFSHPVQVCVLDSGQTYGAEALRRCPCVSVEG